MGLMNVTKNIQVVPEVKRGNTFIERYIHRAIGLMGKKEIKDGQALWLTPSVIPGSGNSIHTFFMRFSIDAIFVNPELKVVAVYEDLKPWKVTPPAWGANSVFEMKAGTLKHARVEVGDHLNVVN